MHTPLERYQQDLARPDFCYDAAQEMAVYRLQQLYEQLVAAEEAGSSALGRLTSRLIRRPKAPVQGLYLWGGVGRGKTYLVDTFYDSLPFDDKMRTHFHRFMQRVHHELELCKGQKNPLELVGAKLASEARVLCFDEFFVSDITDAMILAGLLEQLFARGVTLVATSNIAPDRLYQDGLQRARFLPAIALIEAHTQVLKVDGGVDHRLRVLTEAPLYHYPLGARADQALYERYDHLMPDADLNCEAQVLDIAGRPILSERICEDVGWFRFAALCDGPRSQNDYIELARIFHTVLVQGVPQLNGKRDDQARRFINLVDEFYDRGVKLIISAQVPLKDLYRDGRLIFEFQRTLSRLQEMQSQEYLARPHKA